MTHQSGSIPPESAHRTPGHEQTSKRLDRKLAHIDLEAEIVLLRSGEDYARVGRSAKTLVKRSDMRVLLIAMREGARVAEHTAPGPLTVGVLQGRLRMNVADGTVELPAGHLLGLDRNEQHDVEALANSAFLLTIAWPREP